MKEIYSLILGGVILAAIGYDMYLKNQIKKTDKKFGNWIHNYVKPKAEEINKSNEELKGLIKKLKEDNNNSSESQ